MLPWHRSYGAFSEGVEFFVDVYSILRKLRHVAMDNALISRGPR